MMRDWIKGGMFWIGCTVALTASAQEPTTDLAHYSSTYPKQHSVTLNASTEASYVVLNGGIELREKNVSERFYPTDQAGHMAQHSISFSSFSRIENIEAYTLVPNGKKYKKVKVKVFEEERGVSDQFFYDDDYSINFTFPQIQKGCKTYLSYDRVSVEEHFGSGYYFISSAPAERLFYSLEVPNGVDAAVNTFHMNEADVAYTSTPTKTGELQTWECKNVTPFSGESFAPSVTYYVPHLRVSLKKYEVNGTQKQVLETTDDLFNWYNSLVLQAEESCSQELTQLVDSITAGSTTDRERVEAIFYWAQDNIKYVAVENGLGGFIPRKANDVYQKRYGDCKDMSNIMYCMTQSAGIPLHHVWIGTRDLPYSYYEMPTPAVDNHMVAAYLDGDEYVFLDATGQEICYGQPSSFIQGKEALIRTSDSTYTIAKVPVQSADYSTVSESRKLKIADRKLEGQVQFGMSGYYKTRYAQIYNNLDSEQKERFVKDYLKRGNNKSSVSDVNHNNLVKNTDRATIDYTLKVEDYVISSGDELIVNLNLDNWFADERLEDDRVSPKEFEYASLLKIDTALEIPEGYKVSFLPENADFEKDNLRYDFAYEQSAGEVILKQNLEIDTLLIGPDQFDDWNEMLKQLRSFAKQSVILKKK